MLGRWIAVAALALSLGCGGPSEDGTLETETVRRSAMGISGNNWKGIAAAGNYGATPAYPYSSAPSIRSWLVDELGVGWWYDWGVAAGGATKPNLMPYAEYVPMIYSSSVGFASVAPLVKTYPGKTWLFLNEPDNYSETAKHLCPTLDCSMHELGKRAATSFDTFASSFRQKEVDENVPLGSRAKFIVGGTLNAPFSSAASPGAQWWTGFLANVTQPFDGMHIHAYPHQSAAGQCPSAFPLWSPIPANTSAASCSKSIIIKADAWFHARATTKGKPIWVTEIGWLANEGQNGVVSKYFTQPLLDWLKTSAGADAPRLARVAWFTTSYANSGADDSHATSAYGKPTKVGMTWMEAGLRRSMWQDSWSPLPARRFYPHEGELQWNSAKWPWKTTERFDFTNAGSGELQALSSFVSYVGGAPFFSLHLHRGAKLHARRYPLKAGAVDWNNPATGWTLVGPDAIGVKAAHAYVVGRNRYEETWGWSPTAGCSRKYTKKIALSPDTGQDAGAVSLPFAESCVCAGHGTVDTSQYHVKYHPTTLEHGALAARVRCSDQTGFSRDVPIAPDGEILWASAPAWAPASPNTGTPFSANVWMEDIAVVRETSW